MGHVNNKHLHIFIIVQLTLDWNFSTKIVGQKKKKKTERSPSLTISTGN